MESAGRLAQTAEEIAAQEANGAGHAQQLAEFFLEMFARKRAGDGEDGTPDLMGDIVVHDDAAPGVGGPFRDVRLWFSNDGNRQTGQMRMSGERQKYLAIGKSDVDDNDQIHTCRGQLVGDRHGFVRAEDALGDDRLRIDLPGLEQSFIVGADRLFRSILGGRIEYFDGIKDKAKPGSRPPLQGCGSSHIYLSLFYREIPITLASFSELRLEVNFVLIFERVILLGLFEFLIHHDGCLGGASKYMR